MVPPDEEPPEWSSEVPLNVYLKADTETIPEWADLKLAEGEFKKWTDEEALSGQERTHRL